MILSAHQPNFIPWNPYFEKISQSDIFVIMGNCQFSKNGFQNRFQLNNSWNTMGVKSGIENIIDKKYSNPVYDWRKIKKRLSLYHRKLEIFDDFISESLYKTNASIIEKICEIKGIKTKIVEDFPTDKISTDRLVEICLHYKCSEYLSGPSGRNYLDIDKFNRNGISVIFFDSDKFPKRSILED